VETCETAGWKHREEESINSERWISELGTVLGRRMRKAWWK
jgi:hypothetical protein